MTEEPFVLGDNTVKKFSATDPFNSNNVLDGVICMAENSKFGNLIITAVNGVETRQFVWATPKIHYPFDNNNAWLIPTSHVDNIVAFEKIDGTNILAFTYKNENGDECVSYKTRRMPFVGDDFLYMWKDVLKKHPDIPEIVKKNNMNMAFELYGKTNLHGIIYDIDLDAKVLFGRKDDGEIIPATKIDCGTVGFPKIIKDWTAVADSEFQKDYNDMERMLTDSFKPLEEKTEEEAEVLGYGMEGSVWYVNWKAGGYTMFKCKGDQVREAHQKIFNGISPGNVNQAIFKTLEYGLELTTDNVVETLREDWSDGDIFKRIHMVERMIQSYMADKKIKTLVLEEYDSVRAANPEFDITKNRGLVMRHFANKMGEWNLNKKKFASKVYGQLRIYRT